MKNVFRILILAAVSTTFALPALAQEAAAAASAQDEEAKTALYKKFYDNYKGSPDQQKVAYEAAREYLGKYNGQDAKIDAFINGWLGKYEKAVRDFEFDQALRNGDAARAFQLSRQVLSADPENLKVLLALSQVGYGDARNKKKGLIGESTGHVRKAIQLIESGKTVDNWAPFPNRETALSWLHFYHGFLTSETSPNEAADAFIKAAQISGPAKTEPSTYWFLATVYANRDYVPLAAEYNKLYAGKDATPEGEAMYARLNQVMDRIIDAYARAAALSTKPEQQTFKTDVMAQLTKFYKARNNDSDAGLNELVAGVLSKPLPMPGAAPATPAASAPTTGAPAGTTNSTSTSGTTTTGQPAASNTAKPAATNTPAAKPAAASTQPRPRP